MIAPRFSDHPFPHRRAGPCAAGATAPEGAFSSRPPSGAAYSLLTVPLPDPVLVLLRIVCAHERGEDEAAMISRLIAAHAERIGITAMADILQQGGEAVSRGSPAAHHNHEIASSSPAPATGSVSARARVAGREGGARGALPPPQGPP